MPASPELTALHPAPLADPGPLHLIPILSSPSPLPLGRALPLAGDSADTSDDLDDPSEAGLLGAAADSDAPADSRMTLLEQLERRQDQVLLELDQLDQRVLKLIEELGRYRSSQ
ncbi:MAG: hypothetical protein U0795_08500 [Pirellulales bacterium]